MLKIFMVIYISGHVGGSVGPLPYDMKECLARRLQPVSNIEQAQKWTFIHHGIRRSDGDGNEVKMVCEERADRPKIEAP